MGTTIFKSFILINIILLISCKATQQAVVTAPVERIIEKERVINKPFETIWQSAIELLATYNMPIKNLDKTSGFIASDYKLITGDPNNYMNCGVGRVKMTFGKMDRTDHGGNVNLVIKRITDDSTKVTVNAFYNCTENQYQNSSRGYFLNSSYKIECNTTGTLEKAFLDYLATH